MNNDYTEFVGLTQEVASLVEAHRINVSETKSDILWRILPRKIRGDLPVAPKRPSPNEKKSEEIFNFGEGVKVSVGTRLYLFLSKKAMESSSPDGFADIKTDGLYVDGTIRIDKSRGSYLQPAMRLIQQRKKHFNDKGDIISLSAWRQWHIRQDNQFISLYDCKDPNISKKRRRHKNVDKLFQELDDM